MILLYEVSVVHFIIQGSGLPVEEVSELKALGIENFTIVEGAAHTVGNNYSDIYLPYYIAKINYFLTKTGMRIIC